jgi:2-haloacid dehalogenase
VGYAAVLFDLLTALLDSPRLWNAVAGDADVGRRWRAAYLERTYAAGAYRPYERLVAEAARSVGLPARFADEIAARYGELEPWPEAGAVLGALRGRVKLAVVTNCSEALAAVAVARTGIAMDVVVSAERAGFYKPDPRPYRLGLDELGLAPAACLFVAGSPYDLVGTARVGLPTYWHDRLGLAPPAGAPSPLARHSTLEPLASMVLDDGPGRVP